jgi:plasmid stabilization system protein ParE
VARQESQQVTVKLSTNFERNLNEIDAFLIEAEAPQTFDALLDELTDTVIPNLERFPGMGRSFLSRTILSVETSNGIDIIQGKLAAIGENAELREYVLQHYLMLYARVGSVIHLLSIRHHKQLSFDFQHLWTAS